MTKKKKIQRKKQLYRDTQELARHVVDDHKRRRARFMCKVNECARVNKHKAGIIMFTAQYFYAVDKMEERIVGVGINACKRFLGMKPEEEVCDCKQWYTWEGNHET